MQHGNNANREVTRDSAADLEKAQRSLGGRLGIPLRQLHHVFDPGPHGVDFLHIPADAVAGIHVSQRCVFPSRDEHRQIFFRCGHQPTVFRINLVGILELAGAQDLVHEFVREVALALFVGSHPLFEHHAFDAAHGFHLRDASVGHPVHMAGQ